MFNFLALLLVPSVLTASLKLADYQWKARVIVLRSSDPTAIMAARKKLDSKATELKARDIVILEERTGDQFQIELYGKDGGKKWQDGTGFEVKTILELVDSMPMRKQEAAQ